MVAKKSIKKIYYHTMLLPTRIPIMGFLSVPMKEQPKFIGMMRASPVLGYVPTHYMVLEETKD